MSRFWQRIGREHQRALDEFGLDTIKRHQALEYFTWQWGLLSVWRDPQLRFLLRHSSPRAWWTAWRRPELSDMAWTGVPWSRLKRRLYTFVTRLLWRYAEEHGDHRVLALDEPTRGSPLPVYLDGRLISQDLANTALETRSMGLDEPRSFLEVGPGYGRNAHALLGLYPKATYTIVDIEPALSIVRWYLAPFGGRVRFVDSAEADGDRIDRVDTALTISSLQEMTPEDVARYLGLFDRVASRVYIKQWTTWHNSDDDVTMTLAEYPFPERWRRLLWRRAAVQTGFTEGVWSIPERGRSHRDGDWSATHR